MSEFKLHKKSNIHSNGDGYITYVGHTMMQFDILQKLKRGEYLEKENTEINTELSIFLQDWQRCEFNGDKCESCNNAVSGIFYQRTCHDVNEGRYFCLLCVKKEMDDNYSAHSRWLEKENAEKDLKIQKLEFYRDSYYEKIGDESFQALEEDLENEMEWRKNKERLVHSLELKLLAKEKENAELRASMVFNFRHPKTNQKCTVNISRDQIKGVMEEFIFEKIESSFCHCFTPEVPLGECNCYDHASEFIEGGEG